jgi:hypothetical protein
MEFPSSRPQASNYIHPRDGEAVTLSPPGFAWWRAGERDACQYRVIVEREGKPHYTSPLVADPIHIPDIVFPPGDYVWHVEAVTGQDSVEAKSGSYHFSVSKKAIEQPWTDPRSLLDRIPSEHPRLFFPASQMNEVRASISTTRAEAFGELKRMADSALSIELIPEPDYDQIQDPAERRLAYHACFQATRKVHDQGMRAMALMYLLTGDRTYGNHARALIVDAASWDPEGISSLLAPHGDEVGLGLLRAGAEVYDWLYDLFNDEERAKVAKMVGARADQMIRRLERSDYTFKPEGSHNGRLPGFLLEHAIALAEDERASGWAEYALKIIGTNFPHWAGQDGGWAQGVSYGMSYNSRDAMPFHAWQQVTGHSIWDKPFYQGLPWFFYYVVSPIGEIKPFGDTEHQAVSPTQARTLMQYHGLRLGDTRLRRWADQVDTHAGDQSTLDPFPGILLEDNLEEKAADPLPNDRVFRGVGWGALHSDIANPTEDFMVMFRSSPYGGVSHGHANQNDFAIMKGGKALICAGGERFPHHGTPFHNAYAQQSVSHNCVLVDGEGAINRDGNRGGEIVDFFTQDRFGYVSGEAENAYDGLIKYRRHLLMIRPSVLILVDDLVAPTLAKFEWLLHAFEKFEIDASSRTFVSSRGGASLTGHLLSSTDLSLSQTDEWIVQPDEGYPTLTKPLPPKRWHFTTKSESVARCRIAALFSVQGPGESAKNLNISTDGDSVLFDLEENGETYAGEIDLSPDSKGLIRIDVNGKHDVRITAS